MQASDMDDVQSVALYWLHDTPMSFIKSLTALHGDDESIYLRSGSTPLFAPTSPHIAGTGQCCGCATSRFWAELCAATDNAAGQVPSVAYARRCFCTSAPNASSHGVSSSSNNSYSAKSGMSGFGKDVRVRKVVSALQSLVMFITAAGVTKLAHFSLLPPTLIHVLATETDTVTMQLALQALCGLAKTIPLALSETDRRCILFLCWSALPTKSILHTGEACAECGVRDRAMDMGMGPELVACATLMLQQNARPLNLTTTNKHADKLTQMAALADVTALLNDTEGGDVVNANDDGNDNKEQGQYYEYTTTGLCRVLRALDSQLHASSALHALVCASLAASLCFHTAALVAKPGTTQSSKGKYNKSNKSPKKVMSKSSNNKKTQNKTNTAATAKNDDAVATGGSQYVDPTEALRNHVYTRNMTMPTAAEYKNQPWTSRNHNVGQALMQLLVDEKHECKIDLWSRVQRWLVADMHTWHYGAYLLRAACAYTTVDDDGCGDVHFGEEVGQALLMSLETLNDHLKSVPDKDIVAENVNQPVVVAIDRCIASLLLIVRRFFFLDSVYPDISAQFGARVGQVIGQQLTSLFTKNSKKRERALAFVLKKLNGLIVSILASKDESFVAPCIHAIMLEQGNRDSHEFLRKIVHDFISTKRPIPLPRVMTLLVAACRKVLLQPLKRDQTLLSDGICVVSHNAPKPLSLSFYMDTEVPVACVDAPWSALKKNSDRDEDNELMSDGMLRQTMRRVLQMRLNHRLNSTGSVLLAVLSEFAPHTLVNLSKEENNSNFPPRSPNTDRKQVNKNAKGKDKTAAPMDVVMTLLLWFGKGKYQRVKNQSMSACMHICVLSQYLSRALSTNSHNPLQSKRTDQGPQGPRTWLMGLFVSCTEALKEFHNECNVMLQIGEEASHHALLEHIRFVCEGHLLFLGALLMVLRPSLSSNKPTAHIRVAHAACLTALVQAQLSAIALARAVSLNEADLCVSEVSQLMVILLRGSCKTKIFQTLQAMSTHASTCAQEPAVWSTNGRVELRALTVSTQSEYERGGAESRPHSSVRMTHGLSLLAQDLYKNNPDIFHPIFAALPLCIPIIDADTWSFLVSKALDPRVNGEKVTKQVTTFAQGLVKKVFALLRKQKGGSVNDGEEFDVCGAITSNNDVCDVHRRWSAFLTQQAKLEELLKHLENRFLYNSPLRNELVAQLAALFLVKSQFKSPDGKKAVQTLQQLGALLSLSAVEEDGKTVSGSGDEREEKKKQKDDPPVGVFQDTGGNFTEHLIGLSTVAGSSTLVSFFFALEAFTGMAVAELSPFACCAVPKQSQAFFATNKRVVRSFFSKIRRQLVNACLSSVVSDEHLQYQAQQLVLPTLGSNITSAQDARVMTVADITALVQLQEVCFHAGQAAVAAQDRLSLLAWSSAVTVRLPWDATKAGDVLAESCVWLEGQLLEVQGQTEKALVFYETQIARYFDVRSSSVTDTADLDENDDDEAALAMLGKSLYPTVQSLVGDKAGKITGMLLTLPPAERELLSDPLQLQHKIDDAMTMLKSQPFIADANALRFTPFGLRVLLFLAAQCRRTLCSESGLTNYAAQLKLEKAKDTFLGHNPELRAAWLENVVEKKYEDYGAIVSAFVATVDVSGIHTATASTLAAWDIVEQRHGESDTEDNTTDMASSLITLRSLTHLQGLLPAVRRILTESETERRKLEERLLGNASLVQSLQLQTLEAKADNIISAAGHETLQMLLNDETVKASAHVIAENAALCSTSDIFSIVHAPLTSSLREPLNSVYRVSGTTENTDTEQAVFSLLSRSSIQSDSVDNTVQLVAWAERALDKLDPSFRLCTETSQDDSKSFSSFFAGYRQQQGESRDVASFEQEISNAYKNDNNSRALQIYHLLRMVMDGYMRLMQMSRATTSTALSLLDLLAHYGDVVLASCCIARGSVYVSLIGVDGAPRALEACNWLIILPQLLSYVPVVSPAVRRVLIRLLATVALHFPRQLAFDWVTTRYTDLHTPNSDAKNSSSNTETSWYSQFDELMGSFSPQLTEGSTPLVNPAAVQFWEEYCAFVKRFAIETNALSNLPEDRMLALLGYLASELPGRFSVLEEEFRVLQGEQEQPESSNKKKSKKQRQRESKGDTTALKATFNCILAPVLAKFQMCIESLPEGALTSTSTGEHFAGLLSDLAFPSTRALQSLRQTYDKIMSKVTRLRDAIKKGVSTETLMMQKKDDAKKKNDQQQPIQATSSSSTRHQKPRLTLPVYFQNLEPSLEFEFILPGVHGAVSSFASLYSVVYTKTRPKKLQVTCANGLSYHLLLKRGEDLRLDATVMQLHRALNAQPQTHKAGHTETRTYSVIPLGSECGLIEWVANTHPLVELFPSSLLGSRFVEVVSTHLVKDGFGQLPVGRADWPQNVMLKAFHDMHDEAAAKGAHSRIRDELFLRSTGFESFAAKRRRFTLTAAAGAMSGYLLGLGDRHLGNILMDSGSGEILHIDYAVAFEQGLLALKIPERVAFRHTKVFEDAYESQGLFTSGCKRQLQFLQGHEHLIMGLLNVLQRKPLSVWQRKEESTVAEENDNVDVVVADDAVNLERIFSARLLERQEPLEHMYQSISTCMDSLLQLTQSVKLLVDAVTCTNPAEEQVSLIEALFTAEMTALDKQSKTMETIQGGLDGEIANVQASKEAMMPALQQVLEQYNAEMSVLKQNLSSLCTSVESNTEQDDDADIHLSSLIRLYVEMVHGDIAKYVQHSRAGDAVERLKRELRDSGGGGGRKLVLPTMMNNEEKKRKGQPKLVTLESANQLRNAALRALKMTPKSVVLEPQSWHHKPLGTEFTADGQPVKGEQIPEELVKGTADYYRLELSRYVQATGHSAEATYASFNYISADLCARLCLMMTAEVAPSNEEVSLGAQVEELCLAACELSLTLQPLVPHESKTFQAPLLVPLFSCISTLLNELRNVELLNHAELAQTYSQDMNLNLMNTMVTELEAVVCEEASYCNKGNDLTMSERERQLVVEKRSQKLWRKLYKAGVTAQNNANAQHSLAAVERSVADLFGVTSALMQGQTVWMSPRSFFTAGSSQNADVSNLPRGLPVNVAVARLALVSREELLRGMISFDKYRDQLFSSIVLPVLMAFHACLFSPPSRQGATAIVTSQVYLAWERSCLERLDMTQKTNEEISARWFRASVYIFRQLYDQCHNAAVSYSQNQQASSTVAPALVWSLRARLAVRETMLNENTVEQAKHASLTAFCEELMMLLGRAYTREPATVSPKARLSDAVLFLRATDVKILTPELRLARKLFGKSPSLRESFLGELRQLVTSSQSASSWHTLAETVMEVEMAMLEPSNDDPLHNKMNDLLTLWTKLNKQLQMHRMSKARSLQQKKKKQPMLSLADRRAQLIRLRASVLALCDEKTSTECVETLMGGMMPVLLAQGDDCYTQLRAFINLTENFWASTLAPVLALLGKQRSLDSRHRKHYGRAQAQLAAARTQALQAFAFLNVFLNDSSSSSSSKAGAGGQDKTELGPWSSHPFIMEDTKNLAETARRAMMTLLAGYTKRREREAVTGTAQKKAAQALSRVRFKLTDDKKDTVEALITQASDPSRLCSIYEGWSGWL